MKKIVVSKEVREFLKQSFDCGRLTVYRALTFQRNHETAQKIRKLAILKGGQIVGEDSIITYHDNDDTMVQRIGTRIEIVLWKNIDKVHVYIDGIWKEEHVGMSIDDFMRLQNRVMEQAKVLL